MNVLQTTILRIKTLLIKIHDLKKYLALSMTQLLIQDHNAKSDILTYHSNIKKGGVGVMDNTFVF